MIVLTLIQVSSDVYVNMEDLVGLGVSEFDNYTELHLRGGTILRTPALLDDVLQRLQEGVERLNEEL